MQYANSFLLYAELTTFLQQLANETFYCVYTKEIKKFAEFIWITVEMGNNVFLPSEKVIC